MTSQTVGILPLVFQNDFSKFVTKFLEAKYSTMFTVIFVVRKLHTNNINIHKNIGNIFDFSYH